MPDESTVAPRTVLIESPPDPGQLAAVDVDGHELVLANVGGTVFAFDGMCTHEECPLVDGELDQHLVICECHGGTFDVRTGEPVEGPVHVPLTTFPVLRDGASVFIDVSRLLQH